MSCYPESTYSVYVDGELGPDEVRMVETHLVTCRTCRVLVTSLRDETELLADALHERAPEWMSREATPTPDVGVAMGLPAAVAAATLVISVVGFLLELRWSGGWSLLNPLRLKGVYEMAFDVVFMLRDRAPGLIELALSVGAVAAVSALLSLAVTAVFQRVGPRQTVVLLLAAGVAAAAPQPARAFDLRHGEDVRIAEGEVLSESLVTSGDLVEIDGVLDGDLIVAAERTAIRGTVRGNVYAFTRDLEITGSVDGSVHAATERTRIAGPVAGSAFLGSEVVNITPDGRIGADLYAGGGETDIEGHIARDTSFVGERLDIRGELGRHLDVYHADHLTLRDTARIGGNADVRVKEDEFDVASRASVAGEIVRSDPPEVKDHYLAHYSDPAFYAFLLFKLAASVVFGLVLYRFFPGLFGSDLPPSDAFFRALGVGFLVLVAMPAAIVVCALTVIGIPVAVLFGCIYLVTLYSAHIAVGALIGRMLMGRAEGLAPFGLALLVGMGVLAVAGAIPFVGPAVSIVALLFGAGLIYARARETFGPAAVTA